MAGSECLTYIGTEGPSVLHCNRQKATHCCRSGGHVRMDVQSNYLGSVQFPRSDIRSVNQEQGSYLQRLIEIRAMIHDINAAGLSDTCGVYLIVIHQKTTRHLNLK